MGLGDVIPGVSGGTIALIVGIYERLIYAIRTIDLRFIPYLLLAPLDRKYLQKAKYSFLSIDFSFLFPLAVGIGSAFLAASQVIPFALDNYPAYVYSFFFGLILVSAWVVYGRIEEVVLETFVPGLIGFLFAFIFVGFEGIATSQALPIIFTTGFLAICAMILPGISGSFIVLFLGKYKYMLNALGSIQTHWTEVVVFLVGAFISLFSFSRLLSYLLKRYHSHALFFLTGLMIGALRLPFKRVIGVQGVFQNPPMFVGAILSGLTGSLILVLIEGRRSE